MSANQNLRLRVAVLGGGHGCFAAAADLSEQGHLVQWWRRDAASFDAVRAAGGVLLKDLAGERRISIDLITGDTCPSFKRKAACKKVGSIVSLSVLLRFINPPFCLPDGSSVYRLASVSNFLDPDSTWLL